LGKVQPDHTGVLEGKVGNLAYLKEPVIAGH